MGAPSWRLRFSRRSSAALLFSTMVSGPLARPGWAYEGPTGEVEEPFQAHSISALRSVIQRRLSFAGGQWSVSVGIPGTSVATIAINSGRRLLAASLFKLVLLVEALRLHRVGELHLDEPLMMTPAAMALLGQLPSTVRPGQTMAAATAIERMITVSSNTGAVLIGQRVGWRRAQATVERLGLRATTMGSPPMTTAADMQRLLRLIAGEPADSRLLHPDDAATMRRLLSRQEINDRVPPELHQAGLIAHKTGDLTGLLHDAGLITARDGPVAVVLMATEFGSRSAVVAAMRDVYRAIYQAAEAGILPATAFSRSTLPLPSIALPSAWP